MSARINRRDVIGCALLCALSPALIAAYLGYGLWPLAAFTAAVLAYVVSEPSQAYPSIRRTHQRRRYRDRGAA